MAILSDQTRIDAFAQVEIMATIGGCSADFWKHMLVTLALPESTTCASTMDSAIKAAKAKFIERMEEPRRLSPEASPKSDSQSSASKEDVETTAAPADEDEGADEARASTTMLHAVAASIDLVEPLQNTSLIEEESGPGAHALRTILINLESHVVTHALHLDWPRAHRSPLRRRQLGLR